MAKQSYPLETKLRYIFEDDKKSYKTIPRTTRYYWKKCKAVKDFCVNNLWQKLDGNEPAKLLLENKKLAEQNLVLTNVSSSLGKIILSTKQNSACKKEITACIDKIKTHVRLQTACDYFSVSVQQYYAWKSNNGCQQSVLKLCRKKFPNQLTEREVGLIKKYMDDVHYSQWSRASVYWQICRNEGDLFAKSTFYKYCFALGYSKRTGIKKCKKNRVGIKGAYAGEIIQADVTEVYTRNHEKAYLLFLQDNFSRKIIGCHAAKQSNALLQAEAIKKALGNISGFCNTACIVTDGGSENKGEVIYMLKQFFPAVKKMIAKVDIPYANNMVEALHYKMKYQVLPAEGFETFNELANSLDKYVDAYNNMPHDRLLGCTPNEVFSGVLPNVLKRKEDMVAAAAKRLLFNSKINCCVNNYIINGSKCIISKRPLPPL